MSFYKNNLFRQPRIPLLNILILFVVFNLILAFVAEGNFLLKPLPVYFCFILLVNFIFLFMQRWILLEEKSDYSLNADTTLLANFFVILIALVSIFRFMHRDIAALVLLFIFFALFFICFVSVRSGRIDNRAYFLISASLVGFSGVLFRCLQVLFTSYADQSDMLLLIRKTLKAFFSGQSPYQQYFFDQIQGTSYDLYLTYLPGQWLAYLPTYLFRVDLRWTNIIVELSIYVLLSILIYRHLFHRDTASAFLAQSFVAMLFLNGYFICRIDAEIMIFSGIITLLFFSMFTGKKFLTFVFLGLAVATSQLALLLVPFLTGYYWRTTSVKQLLGGLLLTFAISASLILPFLFWSWNGFLEGVVYNWAHLSDAPLDWALTTKNMNFTVFFYKLHTQGLLKFIQIFFVSAVFLLFVRKKRELFELFAFMAVVMFIFLDFNVVVWTYLYQPVILLTIFSIIIKMNSLEADKGTRPVLA